MATYNTALDETVLNRFLALPQGGKIQVREDVCCAAHAVLVLSYYQHGHHAHQAAMDIMLLAMVATAGRAPLVIVCGLWGGVPHPRVALRAPPLPHLHPHKGAHNT
jgi:hypothetical protein